MGMLTRAMAVCLSPITSLFSNALASSNKTFWLGQDKEHFPYWIAGVNVVAFEASHKDNQYLGTPCRYHSTKLAREASFRTRYPLQSTVSRKQCFPSRSPLYSPIKFLIPRAKLVNLNWGNTPALVFVSILILIRILSQRLVCQCLLSSSGSAEAHLETM